MDKTFELLLVNSLSPRQRIASDAALENSLAVLRTYLEDRGLGVEVIDEQRVTAMEAGVPKWCLTLLRSLVRLQMKTYRQNKAMWSIIMDLSYPVQVLSMYYRNRYINNKANDIIRIIKENAVPFLGIKLWYGDSFTWSKHLAAKVKAACPETVIIAGGPQVKVYGEHVLSETDFDLAIMGPGEELLEKLILLRRNTKSKKDFLAAFQNSISKSKLIKTGIYGDSCPTSAADFTTPITIPRYRPEDLQNKILFHTLVDGFGCSWNKCNFCSHTRQAQTYQPRPVSEMIKEFKLMVQQGISFFRFSSSETPVEHGREIAEEILKAGLNINYSMFVRPLKVTPETYEAYRLMVKSGLRAVFMGGETGHDIINEKIMNKGIRSKQIIDTIHCIRLAASETGQNCRVGLSLIYPCPVTDGVTLQQVFDENIMLIKNTLPDTVIVNPPGVFPKTKWMENANKFGFEIAQDFVMKFMQYEYSIYKPIEFWDNIGYSLQGMSGSELLKETGRLRQAIVDLGIPTDISDEYLMMTEAIGYKKRSDLLKFKNNSLHDIMSGSTSYMEEIIKKINAQSQYMAKHNQSQK